MANAFSYIKAKLLQLGRLKAIDTYVESESVIVYEPDRIISEIPNSGLITKQNALDMISGSSIDVFEGEVIDIAEGTTLTIDGDGRSYVDFDYSPYIAGHGSSPSIFIFQRIIFDPPTQEVNEILYDVPFRSLTFENVLTTIRVFPHVDPSDATKSIDHILILIK